MEPRQVRSRKPIIYGGNLHAWKRTEAVLVSERLQKSEENPTNAKCARCVKLRTGIGSIIRRFRRASTADLFLEHLFIQGA